MNVPPSSPLLLFDFRAPAAVGEWQAIDDRVMGGLSLSRMRHDPAGHAVFEGSVSLAQGGGFASVRSQPAARGLAGAQHGFIELRGEGKRYKLSLLAGDALDGIPHQMSFTPGPTWQTLYLPLRDFRASFRGRELPGATAIDPARIRQLGLLIGERQAGPFALEIRRIGLA